MVVPGFRCSLASRTRDESIAGTASPSPALLLVEEPGPWGRKALRDARLPEGLGAQLTAAADAAGVKVLLIRRPGRAHTMRLSGAARRVFAARLDPAGPRLGTTTVDDIRDVLDLDLSAIAQGRSAELDASDPVYAVCTHGQRDLCCAEIGRPVANALAAAYPDETWEVSHLGGHRFAANLLLLPDGSAYGRLDALNVVDIVTAHREGRLSLDHLRGRSGVPTAVQAAEVAVRRATGDLAPGGVQPRSIDVDGDLTTVAFETSAGKVEATVRTRLSDDAHVVSCGEDKAEPVTEFEIVSVGNPS